MAETRNKVQMLFLIDRDVALAFDKFVHSGEKSGTVNEILKDFLEKKGKINVSDHDMLVQKELASQKALGELESLKHKLFAEKEEKNRILSEQKVKAEKEIYLSSLNEQARIQACIEIEDEMGVLPGGTLSGEIREEFISRWRERHELLLKRLLDGGNLNG